MTITTRYQRNCSVNTSGSRNRNSAWTARQYLHKPRIPDDLNFGSAVQTLPKSVKTCWALISSQSGYLWAIASQPLGTHSYSIPLFPLFRKWPPQIAWFTVRLGTACFVPQRPALSPLTSVPSTMHQTKKHTLFSRCKINQNKTRSQIITSWLYTAFW